MEQSAASEETEGELKGEDRGQDVPASEYGARVEEPGPQFQSSPVAARKMSTDIRCTRTRVALQAYPAKRVKPQFLIAKWTGRGCGAVGSACALHRKPKDMHKVSGSSPDVSNSFYHFSK